MTDLANYRPSNPPSPGGKDYPARIAALINAMGSRADPFGAFGLIQNLSVPAFTVGAGAATFTVKTRDGSNASADSPIAIAVRNATATAGDFTMVSITSAQSLVVPSGATLGMVDGVGAWTYVYEILHAGAWEPAVSSKYFGPSGIVTTTTIGTGADSATVMYSATGRSNVPFRLIDRQYSTQPTAGTWAAAPTQNELWPFDYSVTEVEAALAKGDILVATAAGVWVRKAVGSNGQIVVADSGQTDGLIWTDYSRQPLNTNPNWLIDQINVGALYTSSSGANVLGPDGWSLRADGAGVFKVRTLADPDNAALKVLEITCTTADASIAATDKYHIFTSIEGYDVASLKAGTASASQITLMFESDFSVTGTYGIAIQNSAANRRYIGTFTQAVSNAREQQKVTLTLDTSGTWLYTNGAGLTVHLTLAAGTNFQDTASAWAAGAHLTTSAQANFMSSTSNIGYLGRFHVIPGGVALAYANHDFVAELAKARRSYQKTFLAGTVPAQNAGDNTGEFVFTSGVAGAGNVRGYYQFNGLMRAAPTLTLYNPAAANAQVRDNTASADCSASNSANVSESGALIFATGNGSTAVGNRLNVHLTANARLS